MALDALVGVRRMNLSELLLRARDVSFTKEHPAWDQPGSSSSSSSSAGHDDAVDDCDHAPDTTHTTGAFPYNP